MIKAGVGYGVNLGGNQLISKITGKSNENVLHEAKVEFLNNALPHIGKAILKNLIKFSFDFN